jgi:hypothetical protein
MIPNLFAFFYALWAPNDVVATCHTLARELHSDSAATMEVMGVVVGLVRRIIAG